MASVCHKRATLPIPLNGKIRVYALGLAGRIVEVLEMLSADEKEKLERGFAEGEASLLLEGLKPTTFGLSLKERILAGEISIEQAQVELSAHYIPAASRIA